MTKVGRNDPCPCGSGKKYKQCCVSKNRPKHFSERRFNWVKPSGQPASQEEKKTPAMPDLMERTFGQANKEKGSGDGVTEQMANDSIAGRVTKGALVETNNQPTEKRASSALLEENNPPSSDAMFEENNKPVDEKKAPLVD